MNAGKSSKAGHMRCLPRQRGYNQVVSRELLLVIGNFLKNRQCEVYTAPFDVRLAGRDESEDEIMNVVQPDITIICDKKNLDDRGCIEAPDMIIEIISPRAASIDFKEKLSLYEKYGVKEYWIVHPIEKYVLVFSLKKGEYGKPASYSEDDKIKSGVIKGLEINHKDIYKGE
jgi:Uma2 family endonuclease